MKFSVVKFVLSVCLGSAVFSSVADETVFYWKGSYTAWESWSDLTKWSTDNASTVAPDHVPGTDDDDWLWPYGTYAGGDFSGVIGKFDLGGNAYRLKGYSNGSGPIEQWKSYQFHLTNGTLSVDYAVRPTAKGGAYTTSMQYFLYDATLNCTFPDEYKTYNRIGASSLCEFFYLKSAATANLYGLLNVHGLRAEVSSDSTLTFDSGRIYVWQSSAYNEGKTSSTHVQLDNSGTLNFPNGFDWVYVGGDHYGNELARRIYVNQKAGQTILGGKFQKSEESVNRQLMKFTFSGGKIFVPDGKNAGFYNPTVEHGQETFAEVAADASVTVDVGAAATLDMSLFTYGAGATLTKTGAGRIDLTDRPPSLVVSAGTALFKNLVTELNGVTCGAGGTIAFGVPGNTLSSLTGISEASFSVADDFPKTGIVLTGCPAEVATAVANNFVLPAPLAQAGVRAVAQDGIVRLQAPVVVTARSFSTPTGSPVAGCGFSVSGLESGDTAETAFSNQPTYDFGGCSESGEAGTYEVSVSGLESDKYYVTAYEKGTIWAIDPSDATTFYWAATRNVYSDYGDLANWKMDKALTVAATRLPCGVDKIYGYGASVASKMRIGSMDLCGGSYSIGGFSAGSEAGTSWQSYWLDITNGTFTILDTLRFDQNLCWSHRVCGGATLNIFTCGLGENAYGAFGNPSTAAATIEVDDGACVNVYNPITFLYFEAKISAGGRLVFDDGTFNVGNNASFKYQRTIFNNGSLEFPNGWNWVGGAPWSNDPDYTKSFTIHQQAGEVRLGGDFRKTAVDSDAYRRGLYFSFEGGKIVTEEGRSVAFVQSIGAKSGVEEVFPTVAEGASVEVETLADSSLDMSIFTFGDDAVLTKTGVGMLKLAANVPATTKVEEGVLRMAAAATYDVLEFAADATVEIATTGLVVGSVRGYADANFTVDVAAVKAQKAGKVLITSADSEFLRAVCEKAVLPKGCSLSVENDQLLLNNPGMMLILR